jgi:Icc-related predicted phosphoesterase
MKCLLVADIHYSLPQYDWVVSVAGDYDLVILAGDHLDVSSLVDCGTQSVIVEKYLDLLKARTRLVVCSGNHDLDSRNDDGEKEARWITNLASRDIVTDGQSFVVEDMLFTVCPWWDGPKARETIGQQLAADHARRSGRWVWVYHAPPQDAAVSWSGSRSFGDAALRDWIRTFEPAMVFSGHVHQSPFVRNGSWVDKIDKTWVFNAGHQFGAPPAHVAIETQLGEAVWLSAAGIQSVKLSQPLERPLPRLQMPPDWFLARAAAAAPGQAKI